MSSPFPSPSARRGSVSVGGRPSLAPAGWPLALALTSLFGACSDYSVLDFRKVRRPIYPLDAVDVSP